MYHGFNNSALRLSGNRRRNIFD